MSKVVTLTFALMEDGNALLRPNALLSLKFVMAFTTVQIYQMNGHVLQPPVMRLIGSVQTALDVFMNPLFVMELPTVMMDQMNKTVQIGLAQMGDGNARKI